MPCSGYPTSTGTGVERAGAMSAKAFWLLGWLTILVVCSALSVGGLWIHDITGAYSTISFFVPSVTAGLLWNHGWHVSLNATRARRG